MHKNLWFDFPSISWDDPNRPLVSSDKRLLEQIIYNIVHNAIKYSNWGTKIKMDCKRIDLSSKKQILSITDYGIKIEKDNCIYDLYYRNPDTEHVIDGSGIGLFVVKRIENILGIEVKHTCEPISEKYNIALIDLYINTNFKKIKKDKALVEELKIVKDDLKNIYFEIVSEGIPKRMLSDTDIATMIHLPTYKVEFEVII